MLPASVAVAAFGVRLAQWCIAQPPAMSAAPISASRGRSTPVNASAPPGVVAGDVDAPGVEPGALEVDWGLVVGLLPLVGEGFPDSVAPAAGFAVRISGTTHAAAPALAAIDIRPSA